MSTKKTRAATAALPVLRGDWGLFLMPSASIVLFDAKGDYLPDTASKMFPNGLLSSLMQITQPYAIVFPFCK